MILTKPELRTYFPAANLVLLRAVVDTKKFHNTSLDLVVPTVDGKPWDTFKHAPIVCEVVSAPKRLICGTHMVPYESVVEMDLPHEAMVELIRQRRQTKYTETTMIEHIVPGSMPWHTTVQVKPGDVVWVNPNALAQAAFNNTTIEADGETFYLIRYSELYLKKADKVRMLNGWCLLEPIEESADWQKRAEQSGIIVPDTLKKVPFNDRLAIVRYAGDPVRYVLPDRYDHPEIEVGQVVMLNRPVNRRLEPGGRFFAADGIDYIVARRCDVRAIMN